MQTNKEDIALKFIDQIIRSVRSQRQVVSMESVGLVLGVAEINPIAYCGSFHIYELQDNDGMVVEYLALKDNETPDGTPIGNLTILAQHEFTADITAELNGYLNANGVKIGTPSPNDSASGGEGTSTENRGAENGAGSNSGIIGAEGTPGDSQGTGAGCGGGGGAEHGPKEENQPASNNSGIGNGTNTSRSDSDLVEVRITTEILCSTESNAQHITKPGLSNEIEPVADGHSECDREVDTTKREQRKDTNGIGFPPKDAGNSSAEHCGSDKPTSGTPEIADKVSIPPTARSDGEGIRSNHGLEPTISGKRTDIHRGAAGVALSIAEERQLAASKDYLRAEIEVLKEEKAQIIAEITELEARYAQVIRANSEMEMARVKHEQEMDKIRKTSEAYVKIMADFDDLKKTIEHASLTTITKFSELRKLGEIS